MKLNLKNPIVFFDLETTGTNINSDRIVEICYLKVYPNGNEESIEMRINSETPIPAEASAVLHGIYDADIADCPTFKEVARNIANDIEGCDLAGFNSNRFDIPVLAEEFLRAGVDIDMSRRKFVDVQVIFHKMEQRTLSAAYKFDCGKNLEDAHTAEADNGAPTEALNPTDSAIPSWRITWLSLPSSQFNQRWRWFFRRFTMKAWKYSTSVSTRACRYPMS